MSFLEIHIPVSKRLVAELSATSRFEIQQPNYEMAMLGFTLFNPAYGPNPTIR